MRTRRWEVVSILAALLLALGPVLYFHGVSREYPSGDDADYMAVGLQIYRRFLSGGFIEGIKSLYTLRMWKPILHPVFAVPAFAMTHGQVLSAQRLVMIALFALFAGAVFAVARAYLDRLSSVLVTATVCLLPWVTSRGYFLNSELPFVVFFLGTWAGVFHSNGMSKKWPAWVATVCMGISICVRPVESALFFTILLSAFAIFLFRSGRFSPKELRGLILLGAILLVPLASAYRYNLHNTWSPDPSLSMSAVTAVSLGAAWWFYLKRLNSDRRSYFPMFFLGAMTIALGWFGSYLPHLFNWLKVTSFSNGGLAQVQQAGFSDLRDRFEYFFIGSLTWPVAAIAMLAGWRALNAKNESGAPRILGVLIALLFLVVTHFCMGATSHNNEIRYYVCEMICIYLALGVLLLADRKWSWIRKSLLGLLVAGQLFGHAQAYGLSPQQEGKYDAGKWFTHERPFTILTWDDPAEALYRELAPDLGKKPREELLVFYTNIEDSLGLRRVAEPGAIELLALQDGHELYAHNWGYIQRVNGKLVYQGMDDPKSADFILAGPIQNAEPGALDQLTPLAGTRRSFAIKSDAGPGRTPVDVQMLWIKR